MLLCILSWNKAVFCVCVCFSFRIHQHCETFWHKRNIFMSERAFPVVGIRWLGWLQRRILRWQDQHTPITPSCPRKGQERYLPDFDPLPAFVFLTVIVTYCIAPHWALYIKLLVALGANAVFMQDKTSSSSGNNELQKIHFSIFERAVVHMYGCYFGESNAKAA